MAATLTNQTIGFILSLLLTLGAYFLVTLHVVDRAVMINLIVPFALAQAIIQLLCFLSLGNETKPRWNLIAFLFMVLVLIVIVFGSIWIMFSLYARVMT